VWSGRAAVRAVRGGCEHEPSDLDDGRRGFEGLPEAHLAVVSAGDAGGAGDAASVEATVAAIAGLRADGALLRSLRRDHVRFGPHTVVAADLRDPRDVGTRKAVEAVKRRMRAAAW
jgi:hypothetical protein